MHLVRLLRLLDPPPRLPLRAQPRVPLFLALVACATLAAARSGSAGSIFLTGHDPDFHADVGDNRPGSQHINQRAIGFILDPSFNPFVRSGIRKFLFVESNIEVPVGHTRGRNGIEASGFVDGVDFEHHDASTLNAELSLLGTKYAGLVVASDFGGTLTQAELDILDTRASEIIAFLNAGGGLYALSESNGGVGLTPGGRHYGFLPVVVSIVPLDASEEGISVTPFGAGLGITNADVNGNFYHAVFTVSGGLQAVDVDAQNRILTLAGRQEIVLCPPTNLPPEFVPPTPPCGSILEASPGREVVLTVAASDPNLPNRVTLSAAGLPAGATLTPSLPDSGNPVSTTFRWTPGGADEGDHVVTFAATDNCAAQRQCALTLRVPHSGPGPDCSGARAAVPELWPPNHKLVPVRIVGVTTPNGDPVTIIVSGITQDEPLDDGGDGATCPDARLHGGLPLVRRERSGHGNGRVYRITFRAEDRQGGSCQGHVDVCVPHDQRPGHACVDDGQTVNSLGPCDPGAPILADEGNDPEVTLEVQGVSGTVAQLEYTLLEETEVVLSAYDVAGRRVAVLDRAVRDAGIYPLTWDAAGLRRAIYFLRLQAGQTSLTKPIFIGR